MRKLSCYTPHRRRNWGPNFAALLVEWRGSDLRRDPTYCIEWGFWPGHTLSLLNSCWRTHTNVSYTWGRRLISGFLSPPTRWTLARSNGLPTVIGRFDVLLRAPRVCLQAGRYMHLAGDRTARRGRLRINSMRCCQTRLRSIQVPHAVLQLIGQLSGSLLMTSACGGSHRVAGAQNGSQHANLTTRDGRSSLSVRVVRNKRLWYTHCERGTVCANFSVSSIPKKDHGCLKILYPGVRRRPVARLFCGDQPMLRAYPQDHPKSQHICNSRVHNTLVQDVCYQK